MGKDKMKSFNLIISAFLIVAILLISHPAQVYPVRSEIFNGARRLKEASQENAVPDTTRAEIIRKNAIRLLDSLYESPIAEIAAFHDKPHTYRLADFSFRGAQLMEERGLMPKGFSVLVEAACLLHDIGYCIECGPYHTLSTMHEERSQEFIREYKDEIGLSNRQAQLVNYMIGGTNLSISAGS